MISCASRVGRGVTGFSSLQLPIQYNVFFFSFPQKKIVDGERRFRRRIPLSVSRHRDRSKTVSISMLRACPFQRMSVVVYVPLGGIGDCPKKKNKKE
jgi:hypothetical protein